MKISTIKVMQTIFEIDQIIHKLNDLGIRYAYSSNTLTHWDESGDYYRYNMRVMTTNENALSYLKKIFRKEKIKRLLE